MGFDPRQWPSGEPQPRRVTTNIDALLAENEALRREVQQLRRRLELLERPPRAARGPRWEPGSEAPPPPQPRVTAEQVRRWGDALAAQSAWRELRLGSEGSGLQGVIQDLNQRSFHPGLTLEQRLDRLTRVDREESRQVAAGGAAGAPANAVRRRSYAGGPGKVWAVGDRLRHATFGEGFVTHLFGSGEKISIAVKFEGMGPKILDPRLAPIEPLDR